MANLTSDYEITLQLKDTEISELKKTLDEICNKFISWGSDQNITESKLKTVSGDYNNLKQENEELKELEDHCHSQKAEL
jgi:hypothetical protein